MNDILIVGIYWGVTGLVVGMLVGRFIEAGNVADPYEDDEEEWK